MIRAIRTFGAFTKRSYKLLAFVVAPVVYMAVYYLFLKIDFPVVTIGGVNLAVVLTMESMLDFMLLGGFYSKNKSALEYLQSSNNFWQIIKDVVLVDMIRKLFIYVGGYLIFWLFIPGRQEEFVLGLVAPVFTLLLIHVACFIGRHCVLWNYVYGVGSIIGLGGAVLLIIIPIVEVGPLWNTTTTVIVTFFMTLAVAAAMFGIHKYSMKKVRDSYYD